jgi:hypothetical protein
MEFSREEIIKSLKCCHSYNAADCDQCSYRYKSNTDGVSCVNVLIADALALIKKLTDENERVRFISAHVCVGDVISPEEMKQMRMAHTLPEQHGDPVGERGECGMKHNCMADTVRKFADYLRKYSFMCDPGNGFSFDAIDVDELDDYVKDFLEDEDE